MRNLRSLIAGGVLLVAPVFCSTTISLAAQGTGLSASADQTLTLAETTQVPGRTLQPGSYSIQIVDRLSDRIIVRISQKGAESTTFLALPKTGPSKGARRGANVLAAKVDGKTALKGFTFSDGTVAEFVYPKAEAVALAKANDTKIVAIDPASEGRVAEPSLSSEDMKMVTLWMLTPTPVGQDGPGVQAARYQQVAGVQAPRPPRPAMAALPHTASSMPTLWVGALACACGAGILMRRRKVQAAS